MKSYIGHHTCKRDGGYNYVLVNAPFLAEWPTEDKLEAGVYPPFMGSGYYFWEFNLKQARWWGEKFYNGHFYVLEASINTTDENFLDILGDVQRRGLFLLVIYKLVSNGDIPKDWTVGETIEYLKRANDLAPGIFLYTIIRCQDYKHLNKDLRVYFNELGHFTYFDTRHIFCLTTKNDVILSNKRISFSSKV